MQSLEIITPLNKQSLAGLEEALRGEEFQILHLDGQTITNAATLWAQAARDLPLPEGHTPRGWTSFTDALWGGLADLGAERVAIIWTDADQMLQGALSDLLLAADCFTDLARQAYDPSESGFSHEMILKVFLLGEGANFPALTF